MSALSALACGSWLLAQEPEAPAAKPAPAPEPVVAIHAGTVHPVSGATIADGIVLIRGTRIVAVGSKAEVTVPEGARVLDYPQAHVYPGLVDALTDAYVDNLTRGDGSLDAAATLDGDLRARGDREDQLVQQGITTAFVGNRGGAQWRGQGVVVRPQQNGFQVFAGKEHAALQARLANGPVASHALQRQQQAQALFAAFDGLADYKKALDEHDKAIDKYKKDFADYLAHFEKKKEPAPGATPPANATPPGGRDGARDGARPDGGAGEQPQPGPGGRRGGRRGGNGNGGGGGNGNGGGGEFAEQLLAMFDHQLAQDPKPAEKQEPKPAEAKPADAQGQAPAAPAQDKPPERPKYPAPVAHDPNKDALLAVLDGKLPLRVEAHRADEIRMTLALAAEKKVPVLVLEQPLAGATCASELAKAGVTCVLTDLWPANWPKPYDAFDVQALPAQLQAQGVAFAFGSGSGRRAAALTMMAAAAIGRGLDEASALRALTLTPAELLGVQQDVGSLQVGKLGDLVVTDRPLFLSDCRVLAVLSAGQTQFEAK